MSIVNNNNSTTISHQQQENANSYNIANNYRFYNGETVTNPVLNNLEWRIGTIRPYVLHLK